MKQSQKKQAVIFDFTRTLYDPERDELFSGVQSMLASLSPAKDLYLVTRIGSDRSEILHRLDIHGYFKDIAFVERKTKKHFSEMIEKSGNEYEDIFVVGDIIWEEIAIGNKLGWKTIWFQNGMFEDAVPKDEVEIPWKIAASIEEVNRILNET